MKQIFHKQTELQTPFDTKRASHNIYREQQLNKLEKKKTNYWVQTQKDASACVCLKLKCASCSVYSVV